MLSGGDHGQPQKFTLGLPRNGSPKDVMEKAVAIKKRKKTGDNSTSLYTVK